MKAKEYVEQFGKLPYHPVVIQQLVDLLFVEFKHLKEVRRAKDPGPILKELETKFQVIRKSLPHLKEDAFRVYVIERMPEVERCSIF